MKSFALTLFFIGLSVIFASTQNLQPEDGSPDGGPLVEYLPPPAAPEATEPETKLSNDGYRYKTVRRLKYRQRRDIPQEYLAPPADYLPPNDADTKLADDGYEYKAVRQLKLRTRHRRDVSELLGEPQAEYLAPAEEQDSTGELKSAVNDDDNNGEGYRYRIVRRLKYRRHRRDVADAEADSDAGEEIIASATEASVPVNKYLPAAARTVSTEEIMPEKEEVVKSAELANDGYRYKTVRKLKYRYRN